MRTKPVGTVVEVKSEPRQYKLFQIKYNIKVKETNEISLSLAW